MVLKRRQARAPGLRNTARLEGKMAMRTHWSPFVVLITALVGCNTGSDFKSVEGTAGNAGASGSGTAGDGQGGTAGKLSTDPGKAGSSGQGTAGDIGGGGDRKSVV